MAATRTISALSEKPMSFMNEFCVCSGTVYGSLFAIDTAATALHGRIKPIGVYLQSMSETSSVAMPVLQSTLAGTLAAGIVGLGIPFLLKAVKNAFEDVPMDMEQMDRVYNEPKSKTAGIFLGTLTGLAMSWNIAINPFNDKAEGPSPEITVEEAQAVLETPRTNSLERPGYVYIYPVNYGFGMSPGMFIPVLDHQ